MKTKEQSDLAVFMHKSAIGNNQVSTSQSKIELFINIR